MSQAIWTLIYEIEESNRNVYLDWFHHTHIAEKLARDGYQWASHFEVTGTDNQSPGKKQYIAMFGGTSTAVFLNPCPIQLKNKQDAQTRSMMTMRSNTTAMILNHEWSTLDQQIEAQLPSPVSSPQISLILLDNDMVDEAIGAWCVQEIVPDNSDVMIISKLSNVLHNPKHSLIAQHKEGSEDQRINLAVSGEMGAHVATGLICQQFRANLLTHQAVE